MNTFHYILKKSLFVLLQKCCPAAEPCWTSLAKTDTKLKCEILIFFLCVCRPVLKCKQVEKNQLKVSLSEGHWVHLAEDEDTHFRHLGDF